MCFNPDYPGLNWNGYGKEFDEYFKNRYSRWYFKPLMSILRKNMALVWDYALLTNAKKEKGNRA